MIDVGPIGQTHIGKEGYVQPCRGRASGGGLFPKHQRGRRLLGLMAVRLTLLRAVDPAEADAFRVLLVEDFEGIAVEDPDDEAMILRDSSGRRGCQESGQ